MYLEVVSVSFALLFQQIMSLVQQIALGRTSLCTTSLLTLFLLFVESFQLLNHLFFGVWQALQLFYIPYYYKVFCYFPVFHILLQYVCRKTEHSDPAGPQIEEQKQLLTIESSDEVTIWVKELIKGCQQQKEKT